MKDAEALAILRAWRRGEPRRLPHEKPLPAPSENKAWLLPPGSASRMYSVLIEPLHRFSKSPRLPPGSLPPA
jgi:hypothetical protein